MGADPTSLEQLNEELRRAREQAVFAERMQQIGASVASEMDQSRLVQIVTDTATELAGAQFGAFFYNVIGESGESYTLYTISGVPREAFSKFPMPRNTAVFDPTFKGHGVVRSDDITRDPRYGKNAPYTGMPRGHLPVRSYLAVPVISRRGEVLGGLFFGHAEVGKFKEEHEKLVTGIAGWAALAIDNARLYQAAQREVHVRVATEEDLALALDAAGLGRWDYDLRTSRVTWDRRYREIYELDPNIEPNFEIGMSAILPEDRQRAVQAIEVAVQRTSVFETENRVRTKDGSLRHVYGRGRVIRDESGAPVRMVGVVLDITSRVNAELARREAAERLELALQHSGLGDWSWNAVTDVVTFSPRAADIFEIPPGPHMTWTRMRELLHPDDAGRAGKAVEDSLRSKTDYDIEYRVRRSRVGWRWVAARGRGTYDAEGNITGMIGTVQDVTTRRQSMEQMRVLADLGSLMHISLDPAAILTTFVNFAARSIADYSLGYLVTEDGSIAGIAGAHANLQEAPLLRRLLDIAKPHPESDHIVARAVRSRKTVAALNVTPELIKATAINKDHFELLTRLAPTGAIVAPLVVNERVVGAFAVSRVEGGQEPFSSADIPLIEELARRLALMIENARLYQETERANAVKSEFMATMSHELRTPLNILIGYIDLLLLEVPGSLTDEQRDYLERGKSAAWHQIALVEQILSYTRIDAGKEEVSRDDVDLESLLTTVTDLMRPLADRKGLHLRLEVRECRIVSDEAKLRQIVINLLANAIKFTNEGTIDVALTATSPVTIEVRDTGRGIPEDKLQAVFEPFTQLDRSHTRTQGGTGLGLSIVKRLVEMLGGEIQVSSTLPGGSVFRVIL